MHEQKELYASKIFFNAALPLLKVIANDVPSLKAKFDKITAVLQISALDNDAPGGKYATHFIITEGEWETKLDSAHEAPDVELEFKDIETMNAFFKGNMLKLPKFKGIFKHFGAFWELLMTLLKLSALTGATEPPKDEETKVLMVKCYFYLLSSGISQLNKMGHAEIKDWTTKSPDRVYAFAVDNHPEVSAFIRIKAGKSRAGRGEYKRAMPFFTLRFNNLDSALGTLLGTDDMLEATKAGRLIMEGGPEFGAQLGGFMLEVGALAK